MLEDEEQVGHFYTLSHHNAGNRLREHLQRADGTISDTSILAAHFT